MTITSSYKRGHFAVLASTNPFILKDWSIASCYLYAQRNMDLSDYLTMFILYVTSTCGKFPIPLHWLYIYNNNYTVRMEIFVVCEFCSYILTDTEKNLIRENFPVYNIGIVY